MSAYLIETDGRPLAAVEDKLRHYLPGLDVRLFPLSAQRALLRGHLLDALATEYTAPREAWLAVLGIARLLPLTDEQAVGALQGRDVEALPPRDTRARRLAGLDWHLDAVNVQPAWEQLGGPDAIDWKDVRVAHLDTGYTLHPAFGFPGATWVDVDGAITDMPPLPHDDNGFGEAEIGGGRDNLVGLNGGHGTRVGATICGWHPAAAGGVYYGVAPRVPYLPMRITDAVWINHAQRQLAGALRRAVTVGRVGVVNISLGIFAGQVVPALRQALDVAYEAGVIVVCAAGNIVDPVVAPARLARTVAVAGVTDAMQPWSGSSFGPEVDFSAPAADLRRADVDRRFRFRYRGGGDGTSYATAITSGAAALWRAHHGAALAKAYPQPWGIVEAFVTLARQTVFVPPGWRVGGGFGAGVLDIAALLKKELPPAELLHKAPPA